MHKLAPLAVVLLTLVARWVAADCGGIPFKPEVATLEPDRGAVAVFDSREEIRLLSAEPRASEPAPPCFEVMPEAGRFRFGRPDADRAGVRSARLGLDVDGQTLWSTDASKTRSATVRRAGPRRRAPRPGGVSLSTGRR